MTHFLLLTFLCALIEVSGPGDDEPASVVESLSSAAMAVVEAAAKEAEAVVEVAVAAEDFLARFFAARFASSFSRVDPGTGGDAVAVDLEPNIFLKPVSK